MKASDAIGWGVIGTGGVVVDSMAPAIAASPSSQIVAFASRDIASARTAAQRFGAAYAYDDYTALVANPAVDIVYVATPNALRKEPVLAAARARKHVLCEKPLALDVEAAREMDAACRNAGVVMRVAFQIRLERLLQRVRDIVRGGRLGELRSIAFERTAPLGQAGAWRLDPQQGGILYDVATHLLDLAPWITGLDYREISALSYPDRSEGAAEDTLAILARMGERCLAVLRASREVPFAKNDLVIEGTRGLLCTSALRFVDEYSLQMKDAAGVYEERFAPTATYAREVEAMENELRGKRSVLPDAGEAIRMVEIANAVMASLRTRHAVAIARAAT